MGKVLVKDTTLTDIANAIRTKDGSTAKMYPKEMAGKIGALSTGIEIPNPITAGDTPVFVACLSKSNIGTYSTELIGVTITQPGTYKFIMLTGGDADITIYKNGTSTGISCSGDDNGWHYATLKCLKGDKISLRGGNADYSAILKCLIISIQMETDFTSHVITSELKSSSTRSSSMTSSGVFVNIPKNATYKFTFTAGTGGIVKDNRYVAQLYKNGVAINGATAVWGVDGDKKAAYIGNISCLKGDRCEIYFHSYDRDSLQVSELIAEEI
jgi:hypothetical protein